MIFNDNRALLLLLCISIFLIAMIVGITIIVKSIIYSTKSGNKIMLKYILVSIFCVVIAVVSWLLNFGWLRFILTFLAIPFIHTIAFMIINSLALPYVDKSIKLKKFIVFSYVTYLLGYILLPDGADIGPMYMFFGLIHNDIVSKICCYLSFVSFASNVITLILLVFNRNKIKKQLIKTA